MNSGWNRYREFGITLLRISLGVYYILHAYYGFMTLGVSRIAALNASLGVPLPEISAWGIVLGHLVGGIFLFTGFYARLGALMNIAIMAGAVFMVHMKQGFFMHGIIINASKGQAVSGGYEYSLMLLLSTLAVFFLGGGPFAFQPGNKPSRISLD